jgi:hypothetical protein
MFWQKYGGSFMRNLTRLILAGVILLPVVFAAQPASANVSRLVLHRRTCTSITAYVVYDSFSGGIAPFYAVFTVDLNGNGIFGEAGETTSYVQLNSKLGESSMAGTHMLFPVQDEGTTIAVTAYEVDSAGRPVSPQLEPVSYQCANRPAFDPIPPNTGIAVPDVGITARVAVQAVKVYSEPSVNSVLLGGLGNDQVVNVKARNERGDWVKIDFRGGDGWIMWQTQVYLIGPYKTLPVEVQ